MSTSRHRLDADNVSQNTELSTSTTSTPKPTLKERKSRSVQRISTTRRRQSQLLYLEKYGLNQPGWYEGSQDAHDNNLHDDDDDDNNDMQDIVGSNDSSSSDEEEEQQLYTQEPEELFIQSSPIGPQAKQRPVSIKNFVQNSHQQKRPTRFIKPQKSNIDVMSFPATEFRHVHDLIHLYTEKIYMEGYLYKKNELNTNGAFSNQQEQWHSYYVELCGPILTLWISNDDDSEVYPQYINITDSIVKQENTITFSLNSAGFNLFLFQVQEAYLLIKWILAIRLSCFECTRIQEIYTSIFIRRPQYKLLLNSNSNNKMEGFIQARFPGSTGWKKYWASIHCNNIKKKKHRVSSLFGIGGSGGKKNNCNDEHHSMVEISFYEGKKSKYPLMTLNNVVQVYTIYPESPKLINLATLFKMEGNLISSSGNQLQGNSCLIMTSDTNELVKWLISLFDSFKLYGRPNTLHHDVMHQNALNFGDCQQQHQQRLFLELEDVVNSVDHQSTLLNNKREFNNILYNKMMFGVANRPLGYTTSDRRISIATNATTVQSPIHHLRAMTCASDISSNNDEKIQLDDSDSDESLFKLKRLSIETTNRKQKSFSTPTLSLAPKLPPITPIASKSNSEVSSEASSSASSSSSFATPKDNNPSNSYLPLVQVVGGNNGYTSSYCNKTADTATKKIKRQQQQQQQQQQKQNDHGRQIPTSMMFSLTASTSTPTTPTTPIYASKQASTSSASVLSTSTNDYFQGRIWETSSMDSKTMMNDQPEDKDDDDDKPIALTQNTSLYQQQTASKATSRTGSVRSNTTTNTKTKTRKPQQQQTNQVMMDEQIMLRERLLQQQFMIQQYMLQQQPQPQQPYPNGMIQQPYPNGMVPMMMDPRMMQQYIMMNPPMMYNPLASPDPRFFAQQQQQQQQQQPSTSASNGSYRLSSRSSSRQRYDNQSMSEVSVTNSTRPNYKRQHISSNSITTIPQQQQQQQQQPATRRARNY